MARGDFKVKFTDDNIRKLLAIDGKRTDYTDTLLPGLSIRVNPSSTHRSFVFQYRAGGKQKRYTLGDIRKMSLASAREACRLAIKNGGDPALKKREDRIQSIVDPASALTFSKLIDEWVQDEERYWRPRTKKEWLRLIEKEIRPILGGKLASALTPSDIRNLCKAIHDRPAITTSRRVFELLRRCCNWSIASEKLTFNPCLAARPARRVRQVRVAARLKPLTDAQLRGLFKWTRGTEIEHLVGVIARTGVRLHSALSMRVEDVRSGVWSIPPKMHKVGDATGLPHLVPLSLGAKKVIAALPVDGWAFPAMTTKCEVCEMPGHMDKPNSRTTVADMKEAAGIEGRGVFHRLRDTIKTRMSEAMIDSRVSEHVLGHVVTGIDGVYNHAEMLPQRKAALEWWDQELDRILNEDRKGRKR